MSGDWNRGEVSFEFVSKSEAETEAFGRELASSLSAGDVVYLIGELGAGKTALSRGLAAGLGAAPREVASPTFAILNEYAAPGGTIVMRHLDLYRLADDPRDLEVLGLPGALAGAPTAVEWPGAAIRSVVPPSVEVRFSTEGDGRRLIGVERLKLPPG
ncbi:MAG TPA: tRNA (adenosine(37)-N6)-threonylcarbamoyltransferase complex ATPase subunit type 1 TsaE [Thermoanaerobaculia bacterium]|nr:tRNA (adenosine(37)-N6)-threonylcarbamoyltransferase complex ATPase subunit type 1 TsaE [Thermoanaerobaculia bacterium]